MPNTRRLNVPIHLGNLPPTGIFANAFRILDSDDGCVLEFLVYSPNERRAFLVSSIRLPQALLPVVREQVRCSLGTCG